LRKIRQSPPTEGEDRLIPFLASLVAEDLSPKTVDGYRQDLLAFRRWYRESRGTDLRWEKLGSNDLINYHQHLISVERRRPATVNRRLQALRRFCRWARDGKILKADPGETIKSVRVTKRGRPQGLGSRLDRQSPRIGPDGPPATAPLRASDRRPSDSVRVPGRPGWVDGQALASARRTSSAR
jgi:hypothetical protein